MRHDANKTEQGNTGDGPSVIEPLAPLPPPLPGRTLVLGAGGFLGSQAARWLARSGASLRLLDLSVKSIPKEVRDREGVEVLHCNILDEVSLRRALEGVDQVLNLISATVPSTSVDQVDLELRANVQPTLRLLDAMRDVGTPLIVYPSSGGTIYGDEPPETGFTEESPATPYGSYGLGKLLVEEMIGFYARSGGPQCLILRIANAYGPSVHGHNRQGVINAFLDRVSANEPVRIWGDGSAMRDYVHVEDILSAISELVCSTTRNDIFNVGSGRSHSVLEVLELIENATGRQVQIERVASEYTGVVRNQLDISRLHDQTGWQPRIELSQGLTHLWKSMS